MSSGAKLESAPDSLFAGHLDDIVQMMREISKQADIKTIFREYTTRVRRIYPVDRVLLLRRFPIDSGQLQVAVLDDGRVTIHPWEDSDHFKPLDEGFLTDIYDRGDAFIEDDLVVPADDPTAHYFEGMRALRAIPLFEQGEVNHMIVGLKSTPHSFDPSELPALVWLSNLFGRAVQNYLLAEQVKQAYQAVDREMKVVGEIQQSLLPAELPEIPCLDLATYYETSQRAGGDYYDFFALPDGRWGLLIADVSGHGTPAAVVMAIIHTIAHTYTGSHDPPSQFLNYLNKHLTQRYTAQSGTFVTAFYGIFDPQTLNFKYSSAGHNPPIRRRCGASQISLINKAGRMPLGISEDMTYDHAEELLYPGDRVVLYTDGIIEAAAPNGELFGVSRLGDLISSCDLKTETIADSVINKLGDFTQTSELSDDRTLVVMKLH